MKKQKINIGEFSIENSACEKLLGVKIDNKLMFDCHVSDVSCLTYNDKQSTFIKLLENDNSVSIHQRNLQILAIEMFKVSNGLSPVLMNDIFKLRGEQTKHLT